jgi:hypothetical protein
LTGLSNLKSWLNLPKLLPNFAISFSGQSKSLTFDEALAGAENGDMGTDTEVKSKIPDQCCPSICGKM